MAIDAMLAKVFGTRHEREVKAMRPLIAAINEMEPRIQELTDLELAAQTVMFKEQLAQGASLDDMSGMGGLPTPRSSTHPLIEHIVGKPGSKLS